MNPWEYLQSGREREESEKQGTKPIGIVWLFVKQCWRRSTENNKGDTFLFLTESLHMTLWWFKNSSDPDVSSIFRIQPLSDLIWSLTERSSVNHLPCVLLGEKNHKLIFFFVSWWLPLVLHSFDSVQFWCLSMSCRWVRPYFSAASGTLQKH